MLNQAYTAIEHNETQIQKGGEPHNGHTTKKGKLGKQHSLLKNKQKKLGGKQLKYCTINGKNWTQYKLIILRKN
jgi:hypothetical protein